MIFGVRIVFERNLDFPLGGGFTLGIYQGPKYLCSVWAQVPDSIFNEIYKQGGIVLRPNESDQAFNEALLRWCNQETEARLRDGRLDDTASGIIALTVTAADVPRIMSFRRDKTCEYQRVMGRELFCSAASTEDRSVTFQEGPVRLAPTTRTLCRGCDLPATELVCTHLAHPKVHAALPDKYSLKATQRLMASGYCELGKNMNGAGTRCRAGGNDCWEKEISPRPDAPSVPYSPRELPTAFDFLNVIWEKSFTRPLYSKVSFQKSASLSAGCASQDEFIARVGDLNELLRKMDVPDELLPDECRAAGKAPIAPAEKLKRLTACLHYRLGANEQGTVDTAVDILHAINVVRNKITHGGAELIDALRRLGITYPIADFSKSWDQIRSKATEALTIIRSSLETLS